MSTMLLRRRPRGDDGQVVGALVLLVAFLLLALVTYVVFPLGAASNDRARARTAADAAALAGADQQRRAWLGPLGPVQPGVLSYTVPIVFAETGAADATVYADKNGSTVTRYSPSLSNGRVEVEVRAKHTTNEEERVRRATSAATAEMDIDFLSCSWDTPPPPVPVYEGGPPTFQSTLRCGGWSATYELANDGAVYLTIAWVGDTRDSLFKDLEPRLVK